MELKCSPFAKDIYSIIEETGTNAFNPLFCKIRGIEKALAELKPYIAVLSEEAVITAEFYSELSGRILSGKKQGDSLSLAEAKERSGLSRRVLIPMLEYMDRDGYTERCGNERIILTTDRKEK